MGVNGKQKILSTTVKAESIINTHEVILNPKDNSGVFKDKDGVHKKAIMHDEGYGFITPDKEEIESYERKMFKNTLANGK